MVPETYILSLVKIWSVTVEMFLIWTNVARTNVAWINVPIDVGDLLLDNILQFLDLGTLVNLNTSLAPD